MAGYIRLISQFMPPFDKFFYSWCSGYHDRFQNEPENHLLRPDQATHKVCGMSTSYSQDAYVRQTNH